MGELEGTNIDSALKFFVEKLRRGLKDKLVKVILFGSYAKGLASADSDVDVLIVHSHPDPDRALEIIADAALRTALKHDIPLEPVAMTLHEYSQKSLFNIEVGETGKVIYTMNPTDEAKELAKEYAYLAEKWLEHAAKDLDEEPRFAIDSAYNAAELAVRALILLKGESLARTHGGLITQFMRLYVASREVERAVGRGLHESLMLRNRARYDPSSLLTEREARKVVELARKVVETLKEKVGAHN